MDLPVSQRLKMTLASSKGEVSIKLKGQEPFFIFAESDVSKNTLLEISEVDANQNGEEPVQLLEGCSYEYELPEGCELPSISGIVHPSRNSKSRGRITPNIYVGRLLLEVFNSETNEKFQTAVEIRSIKADYRSEYRKMLEDITAECTELLMLSSSPVTQQFVVDYESDSVSLYQRFTFVQSIVDSDNFRSAVNRIISMPVTSWHSKSEEKDIRRANRIGSNQIRQIASRNQRINLPSPHPLHSKLGTVPTRISTEIKTDSVDNPENRFIKHALNEFKRFCGFICQHIEKKQTDPLKRSHIYSEAQALEARLSDYLNHSLFREVQAANSLQLNSPVLQRKSGYREVLRVWLMYDLAAKLVWKAIDEETYSVGKRDVATLYEYWLFFKLLRLFEEIFEINPVEISSLIKETSDGLGLQLKSGRHTAIEGHYKHKARELSIKFSYNRTFGKSDYPKSGSWTQQMRPDYTLSLWPKAFSEEEAEEQEIIVHAHFDAKYRVEGLEYLISHEESHIDEEALSDEKEMQKQGNYKRADLLKMHAYKDAIRRTVGAYVLYPGTKTYQRRGFHEIIPGLGAFPVSPSNDGSGVDTIGQFVRDVVDHFCNRATQREEVSYNEYKTYSESDEKIGERQALYDALPEKIFGNRLIPPQKDMTVLVGYFKKDQYQWIEKNKLYNIRIDKKNGLEKYSETEMKAQYLLLHGESGLKTKDLWKIIGDTPSLMSKQELLDEGYPTTPSQEYYLVFKIMRIENNREWNVGRVAGHKTGRASSRPFAVSYSLLEDALVHS
jgi:predicted component of viral defense system (DUF524 family)